MLVAEHYPDWLGVNKPVELWIGPVYKDDVKGRMGAASFVGVGPRGGTYPVPLGGLTRGNLSELAGTLLSDARRHIDG